MVITPGPITRRDVWMPGAPAVGAGAGTRLAGLSLTAAALTILVVAATTTATSTVPTVTATPTTAAVVEPDRIHFRNRVLKSWLCGIQ